MSGLVAAWELRGTSGDLEYKEDLKNEDYLKKDDLKNEDNLNSCGSWIPKRHLIPSFSDFACSRLKDS